MLEGDNVSVCIKVSLKPRLSRGPLGDIWEYLEPFSAQTVVRDVTGMC